MTLFVLTGIDKPGAAELRAAKREDHLAHIREAVEVKVRLAGPFLGADGGATGSLLIVEAETAEAAAAFQTADPYARAGLFASTDCKPWRATVGGLA